MHKKTYVDWLKIIDRIQSFSILTNIESELASIEGQPKDENCGASIYGRLVGGNK